MIYLLLAILCSFSLSMIMRFMGKKICSPMVMYMSNYAVCILMSLLFAGRLHFVQTGMGRALLLGVISGALYLLSLHAYNSNINANGLSMASTFNKVSIIVPEAIAFLLFHETVGILQICGLGLALAAIVLLYFDKEQMKLISSRSGLLYLLLAAGFCDSMSNFYQHLGPASLKDYYLLFIFGSAFLFSAVIVLIRHEKAAVQDVLTGAAFGIPNYLSSRFILYSLSQMSAVVVYPVYSVSVLVLLNIAGVLLFGEPMNRKKGLSIAVICIALVLLNI